MKAYKQKMVIIEKKDGVALLTLNRPAVLNALNREMLLSLSDGLDDIKADSGSQGVIITGAGDKAFSAGADISFFEKASPLEIREMAKLAITVNDKVETLGKVVVAAINGYALGGGLELAEACTLRIASIGSLMGHPEVKIGAIAGWGGTTRLLRLIGKGRAVEMLLTGRGVGAEEALDMGLVNRICKKEEVLEVARGLLKEILAQAPLSVRLTCEAINRGLDMTTRESMRIGADLFGLIASSKDFHAGITGFLKKKPVKWSNE